MDEQANSFIGVGIYSVFDAWRLTNVPMRRIRRWVKGYSFRSAAGCLKTSAPLWRNQLPEIDGQVALGFQDLMEVRVVNALLKHGLTWPKIKLAHVRAQEHFANDHPFANSLFQTDGQTVFVEIADRRGGKALLDLAEKQFALRKLLAAPLLNVEFNTKRQAARWWPLGQSRLIVLDPHRSFGHPIVNEEGVPTSVLANAVRVEGSDRTVARWYGVSLRAVRAAVEFEKQLSEKQIAA